MYIYIITGGSDYESGPFNVIIPAGETSVPLNISIIDDNIFEANESFNISIDSSSLSCGVYIPPDRMYTLMVTIIDDDGE